jgi:ABC-type sugar transport system ATPase subunit
MSPAMPEEWKHANPPLGNPVAQTKDGQPAALEMRGISKSFGAVKAVEDVDLILHKGEILGLVGDNAAGKSTLMKLLTAVEKLDRGKIFMGGREVLIDNPAQARRLGIEMIYQDFSLAPNLSIADNIFLGREVVRSILGLRFLDRRKMDEVAKTALGQTGISFDTVKSIVADLSGGQMQAVAIARVTSFNAQIIIMDEPTASLSVKAIPPLLDLMTKLRSTGKSMIFITHRIQDIFSTCDRVMVLRRGRCVGVSETSRTTIEEVTGLVTGTRQVFGS